MESQGILVWNRYNFRSGANWSTGSTDRLGLLRSLAVPVFLVRIDRLTPSFGTIYNALSKTPTPPVPSFAPNDRDE